MQEVYQSIDALLHYAEKQLMLPRKNVDFVRNGIFRLLGLDSYVPIKAAENGEKSLEDLLSAFTQACISADLFTAEQAEYYSDAVMGEMMLSPMDVQSTFDLIHKTQGSAAALKWFFEYCIRGNYIKKAVLDKNPRFEADGLIITINKSKPEFRDPKKAVIGNSTNTGYPKCNICHENEGFAGRCKRTLRTIDITLGGQPWFWQFSPYRYFNEHGIAVNYEHKPMSIDRGTFTRLMDFVDNFPGYFIGCNAPLERIGGSILAHDHYQGGKEILPMLTAPAAYVMKNAKYSEAIVEVLDWPQTVVRVVSKSRSQIEEIGELIRVTWITYNDPKSGIVASDENGAHNAISPTVLRTRRGYEMNIAFRSNVTSEQYPDGVFHAHPEYHMIKKESIGLIEAQGLFILPGILEAQLGEIEKLLAAGDPLSDELADFKLVYDEVASKIGENRNKNVIHDAMKAEIGSICARILENTAVFKDKRKTVAFMESLGFRVS